MITEEELKLLNINSKNKLVMQDLEGIMGEKTGIIKYLRNIQSNYRAKLSNLQAVGKEGEIYIAIKCIEEIINGIETLKDDINKIKEEEKKKEK